MIIPVSFNEQYKWYWIFIDLNKTVSVTAEYLAADAFLLIDSPSSLFIKFRVNDFEQDDNALRNNWEHSGCMEYSLCVAQFNS